MSDDGAAPDLVLVVEDNAMNADVLRENLIDAGYTLRLAQNGAAGVAMVNDLMPDIILMDVSLPILDGLSATRLLKQNSATQGIPILALTARAMAGDRESCLAAGCDDYVSKPIAFDLLLEKMQHHLEQRPRPFVERLQQLRRVAEPGPADPWAPARAAVPEARDEDGEWIAPEDDAETSRLEVELQLAEKRIWELDETLAERDRQLAAFAEERDELRAKLEESTAAVAALTRERDQLQAAAWNALQAERDLLDEREHLIRSLAGASERAAAPAPVQTQEVSRPNDDERIRALEGEVRQLEARNESLRTAFVTLQRAVSQAAEEALHRVAFGKV